MMYDAEAKMLAMKKMTPTEPPNSGPNARLIITNTIRQGQLRHGTVHMMYTCILGVHHGYESCLVPASNCCHCICHISLVPRPFFAEVLFLPGKKNGLGTRLMACIYCALRTHNTWILQHRTSPVFLGRLQLCIVNYCGH